MKGGDLSNEIVPRIALVFEGLVGIMPGKTDPAKFANYCRFGRWKRAIGLYQVNTELAKHMWHVTWQLHYQLDIVTYLRPELLPSIEEWVDLKDLPVHRCWNADANALGRKIATMPYLTAIFDPDPAHCLTYGKRGRILDPAHPDILRAW